MPRSRGGVLLAHACRSLLHPQTALTYPQVRLDAAVVGSEAARALGASKPCEGLCRGMRGATAASHGVRELSPASPRAHLERMC